MKVAIIHDWLTTIGGSEKVLKAISEIYPTADIYTLVASKKAIVELNFNDKKVITSFINKLPFAEKNYRSYLALFPFAIEQFDLTSYDLIISSSHAVAKGIITNSNQLHICYCHSPMRYAWDLYYQYLREANLTRGIKSIIAKYLLHRIRLWDVLSSNRVDYFVANSNHIKNRINKIYKRDAEVIYPNVDVNNFFLNECKEDFYFTYSRFVPYKKIDIIVDAFAGMPNKKLVLIGDGPEKNKILKKLTHNIVYLGYQPQQIIQEYLGKAKALIFAAEEDFGIIPVEAQACGTPVIAFGRGGALETVIENKTGLFFYEQSSFAIQEAVYKFESYYDLFIPKIIRSYSEKYNINRFKKEFTTFVEQKLNLIG